MPRDGYINLTLKKSIRNRLARIARHRSRTMTEQLEDMLNLAERTLGLKDVKPTARPNRATARSGVGDPRVMRQRTAKKKKAR